MSTRRQGKRVAKVGFCARSACARVRSLFVFLLLKKNTGARSAEYQRLTCCHFGGQGAIQEAEEGDAREKERPRGRDQGSRFGATARLRGCAPRKGQVSLLQGLVYRRSVASGPSARPYEWSLSRNVPGQGVRLQWYLGRRSCASHYARALCH